MSRFGSAIGLSAIGMTSKVLAIAKTMLIAALFGASATLDAFWVAYTLPLLLPALLTNVVTVAFVPRFMASLEGREGVEAWRGANTLFTTILLLSALAAAAMMLWAPLLVGMLAPGLAPETQAEAVRLTRVLMPTIPLLTVSSLLSAISNARERFTLPALEGVLTNLAVIACALALVRPLGVTALIVGVVIGLVIQAAVLLAGNWRMLVRNVRPALDWHHPDFRAPAAHLLPLLVGSAGSILASLVSQYFLSHGEVGAISLMAYATMFAFLPVEVFAQAVITTFYPTFGRHFARRELEQAAEVFADGARFVLFLTVPCAILLLVFAEPLMVLMLERGAFGAEDSRAVATLAAILAVAMVFRAFAYFNHRILHAALRPWLQVGIGLACVATHVLLCALWIRTHGAVGVALALTVASVLEAVLSAAAAAWVLRIRWHAGLALEVGRLALVALPMALVAYTTFHWIWPPAADARIGTSAIGMGLAALSALVGLAAARLFRQPDLDWLLGVLRRRRIANPQGS